MIIETTSNEVYRVRPHQDKECSHLLIGNRLKRSTNGWADITLKKDVLISKAHILRTISV